MFKDFFNETDLTHSLQRLVTFILVVSSVGLTVFACVMAWFGMNIDPIIYILVTLLSNGVGSKVISKFAENKTYEKQ